MSSIAVIPTHGLVVCNVFGDGVVGGRWQFGVCGVRTAQRLVYQDDGLILCRNRTFARVETKIDAQTPVHVCVERALNRVHFYATREHYLYTATLSDAFTDTDLAHLRFVAWVSPGGKDRVTFHAEQIEGKMFLPPNWERLRQEAEARVA